MIRSTPHPPETLLIAHSENLGNLSLFKIKPDVRIVDALILASEYLACTAAIVYETAENSTPEYRPLSRAAVHQLEAARMLVEASVAGLEAREGNP
jgi:hypothetical protein